VRSFAIITTTPNELCAELHDRMPVILARDNWPVWLGEEPANSAQLKALLAPYPSEELTCWPVSPRGGNVKNNDPSLIEPIAVNTPDYIILDGSPRYFLILTLVGCIFPEEIGIGGHLAVPPLPHHRAYGSRTTAVRPG